MQRKIKNKIIRFLKLRQKKALLITGACVKIGLNQEKPYK